jgi:hypothetical protein
MLGAIRAPLNHCFIFRIFLESFKNVFKKNIKITSSFINIIMLRCIFFKIQNMSLKNCQTVVLMSKLLLSYFYATFK